MTGSKVVNNPRANEGDVDPSTSSLSTSRSSLSRHAATLTAAALTLTASDKALAAKEYSPTQNTEPSKSQRFLETPKPQIYQVKSGDSLTKLAQQTKQAATDLSPSAFYRVKSGDTLSQIATRFKISQSDIREVNPGLDPDKLRVDQSIKLPHLPKGSHILVKGDNPSKIAGKYGITVKDLLAANPKIDPNHLMIGEALVLPAHKQAAAPQQQAVRSQIEGQSLQKVAAPVPPISTQQHSTPAPESRPPLLAASPSMFSGGTSALYASLVKVLGFEGGISRSGSDAAHQNGVPVTNMGITGMAMKEFIRTTERRDASNAECISRIENLTTEEAIKIYASGYWRKDFQPLGSKLSFLMFDWGVTSHPTTVTREFQGKLGVPKTGRIDDATVAAVKGLGEARACELFTDCRKDFYAGLAERRPSDRKHLPGWNARAGEALNFVHSSRFEKLVGEFQRTEPRGCDLFDPVRGGTIVVRKGSPEPAMMRVLQERLTRAGWTVAVDGRFGPEMERVIGNFKSHFGLPGKAEWGKDETKVLDVVLTEKTGHFSGLPGNAKILASRK